MNIPIIMNTETETQIPIVVDEREGWTSASNAQADLLCPGRHLASRGIQSKGGADADFGNAIHGAMANGDSECLTPEQENICSMLRDIEKRKLEEFFGPDANRVKTFREERLWLELGSYKHSGRLDVLHRHGLRGLVIEYKTLAGDVPDSPLNLQLRDQAVLAATNYVLTEVGVCVAQPLVTMNPEIAVYDADALDRSLSDLNERVANSNNPNAIRIAGAVQCKFCPAKDTCKIYASWAASLLPANVNILGLPVSQWSPEQMALFLQHKASAQKWLDECEAYIRSAMEQNPNVVPGYTLGKPQNRPTIEDPEELYARFCELGGTQSAFMDCVNVGKGEFEKKVREVTGLKGKALDAKVGELFSGILKDKFTRASIIST